MNRRKRIKDLQLIASWLFNEGLTYKSYVECCNEIGVTPEDENSNDYWNWVSEQTELDYEDFFENLKYGEANDECYIITFDRGLWDGHKIGYKQKVFTSLEDAIHAALESSNDYWDYEVRFIDGAIQVCGAHHDGRNYFTIRQLSCIGKKWFDDEDVDWDDKIQRKRTFRKFDYYSLWENPKKDTAA